MTCRDLYERRLQIGDRVVFNPSGFPDYDNALRAGAWAKAPYGERIVARVYPETGLVMRQWFIQLEGDESMWDGRLFRPAPLIGR